MNDILHDVAYIMSGTDVGFHRFMNGRMILREASPHAIVNYGKENKVQQKRVAHSSFNYAI
jgi:hypothetical protein